MKTQILKAVAMPPKLFWAPMFPACMNFVIQMAIMVILMGAFPGEINPIVFIFTFAVVHVGLIIWGTREPHLSTILPTLGQARVFWNKESKIKTSLLEPKIAPEGAGIIIGHRQIRVVRLRGEASLAAEWRQWLMAMARYPVTIQIWVSSRSERQIILSAKVSNAYRLREATQDTLSALQAFQPEELSVSETDRVWKEILEQKVKYLKEKNAFVVQNSQKYMGCLSIDRWGDMAESQMISDLLALNEGVEIKHTLKVWPSVKANVLLMQERKMAFFSTFSEHIYNQYTAALEAIDSRGELPQVAVRYGTSLWINARTVAELDQLASQVISVCERYGVRAVREKSLAKGCYISQFTGVLGIPRRFLLLSDNVISLLGGGSIKRKGSRF